MAKKRQWHVVIPFIFEMNWLLRTVVCDLLAAATLQTSSLYSLSL